MLSIRLKAYLSVMREEKSIINQTIATALSIFLCTSSAPNIWAMRAAVGKAVRAPGTAVKISPAGLNSLQPLGLTGFSSSLIAPSLIDFPQTMSETPTLALPVTEATVAPEVTADLNLTVTPTLAIQKNAATSIITAEPSTAQLSGREKKSQKPSVIKTLGKAMEGVTRSIKKGNFTSAQNSIGTLFEGGANHADTAHFLTPTGPSNPSDSGLAGGSGNSKKYPHITSLVSLTQLPLPGTSLRVADLSKYPSSLQAAVRKAIEGENNGYIIITSPVGLTGQEKTAIVAKVKKNGENGFLLAAEARIEVEDITGKPEAGMQTGRISKVRKEKKAPAVESHGQEFGEIISDILDDLMAMAETHPEVNELAEQVIDADQSTAIKILFANVSLEWQHKVLGFDSQLDQLKVLRESFQMGRATMEEKVVEKGDMESRIINAKLPPAVEKQVREEMAAMEKTQGGDAKIAQWLDFILELPWEKRSKDNLDLKHAREVLDRDHFGLEKVKTRILEFLAVRKRLNNKKGAILLFTGPPGTGKTSIAKGIAEAMGREYVRIALGGVGNESKIRGHGRTYQGSKAGVILETLRRAGTKNPVMVLDEVEKMPAEGSANGDPMAALLEVLDPEQNHAFTDHYLDQPFDLSEILFVATANDLSRIPGPLRDRMEIIEYSAYTEGEKVQIGERYLDARARKETGLKDKEAALTKEGMTHLIRHYTMEAGVRNLTRAIEGLYRKIVSKAETGDAHENVQLTPDAIDALIGPAPVGDGKKANNNVGVASALAVSGSGGSVLPIEVNAFPNGKGKLEITGNLKETMNESARVALTLVRSIAPAFGIDDALFNSMDLHIHVPQGGTPKDGPSAGITLTTAITSRLTGRPVKKGVAMTGEVYTNGEVHAIGGLREKAMGAAMLGYTTVLFPKENEKDVESIPEEVREQLTLIPVDHIDQVLEHALEDAATEAPLTVKKPQVQNKATMWLTGLLIGGAAVLAGIGAYVAGLI